MRAIWKFEVPIDDDGVTLELPRGAEVVHVGMQGFFKVTFWAEVDLEFEDRVEATFRVFPTGGLIPDEYEYVGTTQWEGDGANHLVWHLYERVA